MARSKVDKSDQPEDKPVTRPKPRRRASPKSAQPSGEPRAPRSSPTWDYAPTTTEWDAEAQKHPTLLIRRTLRSGQRVRFYGNVVVLGDVNPGAEIKASGDIIVMGWLRGLAHAGADGDETAMVTAFRLNPTQLRIAQYIGRAPDHQDALLPDVPEYAEVRDGQLVIDRWHRSILSSGE
ncbi:Septum formation inhibitor MinC [Sulfobacillus acidophilus DSM 10332]|uniref:Septum formation inhibitor MinC n=1 Tax=Sulfobacillus acidophilus (strain ATCC 700253 / DSM 10332 / NAL) TaxID=679936 RepID=G8U0E5_SULAD|nr:Septum formation inhibitor MinC [Sulfobacillus acidophilus DSM 10332]